MMTGSPPSEPVTPFFPTVRVEETHDEQCPHEPYPVGLEFDAEGASQVQA